MLAINVEFIKESEEIQRENAKKPIENKDIYVTEVYYEIKTDKDGNETKIRKENKINLTKRINETAKLVNQMNAEERLKKLENILNEGE